MAGKGTQEAKQLLTTPALSQTGEAVPRLTDSGSELDVASTHIQLVSLPRASQAGGIFK